MAVFRCSCHQITWGRDGLIQSLDDIREFGYMGTETFATVVDDFVGREAEFKALLDERGLVLSGLYGGGAMHEAGKEQEVIDHNLKIARFLQYMGSDRLVLGPGRRPEGGPTEEQMERMARVVTEICRGAREHGVLAGVHPHWNTVVQEREEITQFWDLVDTDLVKMVLDAAHIAKAGDDPLEVAETYKDVIIYAHIKDYSPELDTPEASRPQPGHAPSLAFFSELGTGIVDNKRFVEILRKANFDGWLTVELDRTQTTPRESLRNNTRYMTEEMGLDVGKVNH